MALDRRTSNRTKRRFSCEIPKSLRRDFRRLKSYRKVAEDKHVNVAYVYRALKFGERPSNPRIAKKLGFKVRMRYGGDGRLRHNRWFNNLEPWQQDNLIQIMYNYREGKSR